MRQKMMLTRLKTAAAAICLCVAAAVIYGEIHDQITVRVCLEYFTIGHPLIFGDQSPTILAMLWGFVATWWMGLFLGIVLALAATAGSLPICKVDSLVKPVVLLLVIMAICACVAGLSGYFFTAAGWISLNDMSYLSLGIPKAKQAAFMADLFAHNASYFVGFSGGLVVAYRVWISRRLIA
jgi:hypothetical protein